MGFMPRLDKSFSFATLRKLFFKQKGKRQTCWNGCK
ncbi:hypothetical protein X474_15385 [Dethiosulfatarculus sandiegensis]|uniref:Uncharacterized protein n=1 Tax=Dethiosulfatarculus sandiegensis TaxID=1429043 RepID=A0A0D2GDU6_9BACT|nr:hypothetical protein X474_15385 [Dethiosulfatarculus sandiegensis]